MPLPSSMTDLTICDESSDESSSLVERLERCRNLFHVFCTVRVLIAA